MKILNPRAALLSKFEVLTHFTEMYHDNAGIVSAVSSARIRTKAENDGDRETLDRLPLRTPKQVKVDHELVLRGVSEDVLFVTEKVVNHLSADFSMTSRQTAPGVYKLTNALQAYGLTKAEILQIVDLLPTKLVELYIIIEECETRLTQEQMESLLDLVASTLLAAPEAPYAEGDGYEEGDYTGMDGQEGGEWNEEEAMMQNADDFVNERGSGGEGGIEDEGDGAIDE